MSPLLKLHLGSASYCALLIGLNWSKSIEYSRSFGVTNESLAPVGVAFLLSAGVALHLAYRCVRAISFRLETGEKLSGGRWIYSWSVVFYALPLLWRRTTVSTWIEPDGAMATATGGYGHATSSWLFILAIIGLLLFQILTRLLSNDEGLRQPLQHLARG